MGIYLLLIVMSNHHKILAQFKLLGYMQDSQLTQYEFNKSLDKLLQKNASIYGFDRHVSQEIWNKTHKQQGENTAWLMNLIDTIIDAQQIVRDNIQKEQDQVSDVATQDLISLLHDDRHLSLAFGLNGYTSQKLQSIKYPQQDNQNKLQNKSMKTIKQKQIQLDSLQSSPKLKNIMIITLITFFFQLFVMCHKHHFYNGLVQLGILLLVFANFFGKTYNKFIIKLIIGGIVLDIIWLIFQAQNYWSPDAQTLHSNMNGAFLKLIYLLVIFLMIPKVMIIILLVQFWNVERDYRKKVQFKLFSIHQSWIVDGKQQFNIIANLLKADHDLSSNFQL